MVQLDGHQTSQQSSSMFADTRTVLKLLATVKRVVSKLKIELHQDYLQLGQINVNIASTPSSQMSQATFEIITTENALQPPNLLRTATENTQLDTNRVKMGKIIDEMQGLTFEPSQSSERENF